MPVEAGDKMGSRDAASSSVSPALVLVAGWLVPGAGHALLGKWVRAVLLMVSIVGMFAIGIALAGKVYSPNTGEPLDMLGPDSPVNELAVMKAAQPGFTVALIAALGHLIDRAPCRAHVRWKEALRGVSRARGERDPGHRARLRAVGEERARGRLRRRAGSRRERVPDRSVPARQPE